MFTQVYEIEAKRYCVYAEIGLSIASAVVGASFDRKFAWMISTKNIETILNVSMLDSHSLAIIKRIISD